MGPPSRVRNVQREPEVLVSVGEPWAQLCLAVGGICPEPAALQLPPPPGPKEAHLQVGPLDPPDAARGIAPGLLGGVDELISRQLVGSCCFYLLCYSFQPGQMFLYFCPGGQEDIRKINNEMVLNGD